VAEAVAVAVVQGKTTAGVRMTEAMKRREREYTAEERTAKDFWFGRNTIGMGSGILRFKIDRPRIFGRKLGRNEEFDFGGQDPEIVDALVNVEETAKQIRAERATREKRKRRDMILKWRNGAAS